MTCHAKPELPALATCFWPLRERTPSLWPGPAAILRRGVLPLEGSRRAFQMDTSREYFHQRYEQYVVLRWEGEGDTGSHLIALPAAPSFPANSVRGLGEPNQQQNTEQKPLWFSGAEQKLFTGQLLFCPNQQYLINAAVCSLLPPFQLLRSGWPAASVNRRYGGRTSSCLS